MGRTVVFTVSLDADDVAIEQVDGREPRRPVRDALRGAAADRRWWRAALASCGGPGLACAVTFLITGGAWVTTVFVAAAAVATTASAAWAGARPPAEPGASRAATWLVTGIAGASLAVVSVPGLALAARAEGTVTLVPVFVVLGASGAAGAWLGLAVAARGGSARAAVLAVVACAVAPLGLAAALLPATVSTDSIIDHVFTTADHGGKSWFVCDEVRVQETRRHTERVAWLTLASPIAWIVDAPSLTNSELAAAAPGSLARAQAWTRSTRTGPDDFTGYCYQPTSLSIPIAVLEARYAGAGPVGANLAVASALLAGAFAAVTRRRSGSRSAN